MNTHDNIPPEVAIPLAIGLWLLVAYTYKIRPWWQNRKKHKHEH